MKAKFYFIYLLPLSQFILVFQFFIIIIIILRCPFIIVMILRCPLIIVIILSSKLLRKSSCCPLLFWILYATLWKHCRTNPRNKTSFLLFGLLSEFSEFYIYFYKMRFKKKNMFQFYVVEHDAKSVRYVYDR
uniref:Uncharacterized protein n=1 Tax=Cacopsylla melanoneura TaxID=428564 RepID=A0A8D9AJ84_9HEMI